MESFRVMAVTYLGCVQLSIGGRMGFSLPDRFQCFPCQCPIWSPGLLKTCSTFRGRPWVYKTLNLIRNGNCNRCISAILIRLVPRDSRARHRFLHDFDANHSGESGESGESYQATALRPANNDNPPTFLQPSATLVVMDFHDKWKPPFPACFAFFSPGILDSTLLYAFPSPWGDQRGCQVVLAEC